MKQKLRNFFRWLFVKKHLFPVGALVHQKTQKIVFEIEFNWFDEDLQPVSLVRQVSDSKVFSIRYHEMLGFKEYSGNNEMLGSNVHFTVE